MSETNENKAPEKTESKGLDALKSLQTDEVKNEVVSEPVSKEPKIDDLGRSYATGRRKESIARVWLKRGKGKISVNGGEPSKHSG